MILLISKSGRLKIEDNFSIGVCPENANPGEILHDFTHLPRLVEELIKILHKSLQ